MVDTIYKAPDIRKQRLEDAEEFINAKRVQRLIMAESYQQTIKQKAEKLRDKNAVKFEKQSALFDAAMERLVDQIEKMQERLYTLNDINTEMVNLEGVINDES